MTAKIITIGDEILIGQIVDTNSAWIAAHLSEAGFVVAEKLSVGDDADAIRIAVDAALNSADVVITTGGIGPTRDDITKNVIADMFGCRLELHEQSLRHITALLEARGVEMNELNHGQAMIPACARVLPNRNGTAPGMWFERDGHTLVVLPGVPFEMEQLMLQEVLPRLSQLNGRLSNVHVTMQTSGIPESMLARKIAAWEDALPAFIKLAYLPSAHGVKLRLSAYGVDPADVRPLIGELFAGLEKIIPQHVVGYGEEASVESYVAGELTRRGLTLAVAESCTGGRIASRFTAMDGASKYFLCGVVSYSNKAKVELLGVNQGDIDTHGAVSREVAEQMAVGVRRAAGADYAISVTGVAGPAGGTPQKPIGTVWIAVAGSKGIQSALHNFGNLRAQNIERSATAAINMLRKVLQEDL